MRQENHFYILFHSNCGSILLSFRDMTTGRRPPPRMSQMFLLPWKNSPVKLMRADAAAANTSVRWAGMEIEDDWQWLSTFSMPKSLIRHFYGTPCLGLLFVAKLLRCVV